MATTALVAGRVLPFDADEYRERQKKAREKMKNQGIDVMILFAQESMYYLFGYDGGGFVFFQAVVMNVDASAQTALLCRMPDVAQASPLFDVCEVWVNAPENNPARDLIKLLGRVGITPTMKLGLETDTYGLTGRNYALLIDTLDEYGYQRRTEASHVVRALRLTKSAAEIEKMRQASKLCDQAFHAGLDAARGGVRDSVVSGTAMAMMVGNGGDLPPSWLVNSGDATSLGRSLTGGRVLNDTGDSLVFEICGVYHRYCVVVERTVSLGTPSASKLAMHDAIKLALQKMMSIAKSGITLGDLYEAASSVLTGKGYKQYAAYGYSLGATYRPTWMDTTDMNSTMIFRGNSLVLQPGMTFLFNLMVSDESGHEGGCGLSDTVLITSDGCESLTSLPHELIIKPLQ